MLVRDGTRYGTGSVPYIAPLSCTRNRKPIWFYFAFVRPELIDDPRNDTAEAHSRNSEEVVALLSVGCGGYSFMGKPL